MSRLNRKGWILLVTLAFVVLMVGITLGWSDQKGTRERSGETPDGLSIDATGTVELECSVETDRCEARIRFDQVEPGTDLWRLREKATFGPDWKLLDVTVTAGFRGTAGYEKRPERSTLLIYGERPGQVSYQLLAPISRHSEAPTLTML